MAAKSTVSRWDEEQDGRLTEAKIRLRYGAPKRARVSCISHEPHEEFEGTSKPGTFYVLAGSCTLTADQDYELTAGGILHFSGGDYHLRIGPLGVTLIKAWEFPPEFQPD